MGTGKLLGKPNKLWRNDLRWTSILSRGSRNTLSSFMLQKPGISSGSYGPLGSKASLTMVYGNYNFYVECMILLHVSIEDRAIVFRFDNHTQFSKATSLGSKGLKKNNAK